MNQGPTGAIVHQRVCAVGIPDNRRCCAKWARIDGVARILAVIDAPPFLQGRNVVQHRAARLDTGNRVGVVRHDRVPIIVFVCRQIRRWWSIPSNVIVSRVLEPKRVSNLVDDQIEIGRQFYR